MQLRPEAGETCRAEAMEWDSVVGRHARRRERAGVGRATEPERGGGVSRCDPRNPRVGGGRIVRRAGSDGNREVRACDQ